MTQHSLEYAGFVLRFIGEVRPSRDRTGRPIEYVHDLPHGIQPNLHAAGPFCHFEVDSLPVDSGVYAITANDELRYIGECRNLSARFGPTGYGRIDRRNCHKDGQSTNCKINSSILAASKAGAAIALWFHLTRRYKAVESEILNQLSPPWNGKKGHIVATDGEPIEKRVAIFRSNSHSTSNAADPFQLALEAKFSAALAQGMEDVEVNAGQLHGIVGGYPGSHHRMPTCCKVMKAAMMPPADYIVASPLKGMGASLTIRYAIPRQC